MVQPLASSSLRVLVFVAVAGIVTALSAPASARPSRHHASSHQSSNWTYGAPYQQNYQPYQQDWSQPATTERPRRLSRHAASRRANARNERRASRHYVSRRVAARTRAAKRERFDRTVIDHRRPIDRDVVALGATLSTHEALWPQDGVSTQDIAARTALARAASKNAVSPSGGGATLVAVARRYIGSGNPTGRKSLWCARFMNMVLQQTGHRGTGSDMASSFASYGKRVSGPQIGAIAVMSRGRRGGHVGVVSGFDRSGNPLVVSGNHGRRVAEAVYSRKRIYAYVMP